MNKNTFFDIEQSKENALNRINIINFIDVALVLVITLMIVSPMIEQGIEVKLPVSGPGKMAVQRSVMLTVAKNGVVFWGNQQVSIENLEHIVNNAISQNPELGIVIKGDKNITYQELISVLDILKRADVKKIGLATQAKTEK
ncbi:MAG TPA: biopolymer transporter ExbD [bacterium]|nr:biopolymer transporter ExbD [bacterium]HOL49961.1 biopolymer transporter ExbD [bacterium]HPO51392.1 biopolymer transporter ExbD [bacterium]HXK44678.1 biopolymer transporter ExbD [bacterium]